MTYPNKISSSVFGKSISDHVSNVILLIYFSVGFYFLFFKSDQFIEVNMLLNNTLGPFESDSQGNWYFLGTDNVGRDLLAVLGRGCYISVTICGFAVLLSSSIGFTWGAIIGYFGDDQLKLNIIQKLILMLSLVLIFYWIYIDNYTITQVRLSNIFILRFLILLVLLVVAYLSNKLNLARYSFPIDKFTMNGIAAINTIPGIFLILFLLSIHSSRNHFFLILAIFIILTPTVIRVSRNETKNILNENYIVYSKAIGKKWYVIIVKEIMPNIIQPLLVIFLFNFIAAIMIESSISFLGMGLPVEEVSWGKTLSSARSNIQYWWLAVFPGLCIFLVVWSLNKVRKRFAYNRI